MASAHPTDSVPRSNAATVAQLAAMSASILRSQGSSSTSQARPAPPPPYRSATTASATLQSNKASQDVVPELEVTMPRIVLPRRSALSLAISSDSVARSESSRASLSSLANTMLASPAPSSLSSASSAPPARPSSYSSIPPGRISTPDRPPKLPVSPVASLRKPPYRSPPTSPTVISANQAKASVAQLRRRVSAASTLVPPRHTKGLLAKACATDLLFLIDATHSMKKHIDAARDQVKLIIADIKQAFLGESVVRIAVVAYRDHTCSPHIEFLDFTTSTEAVHKFLDGLETRHGIDFAEDVLGGIQRALDMSWDQQTRCIVHIGDAPCHGGTEMHDLGAKYDNYPKPGSEPHGLMHEPLLQKMIDMRINYFLLSITKHTDKMALKFSHVYAAAGFAPQLLPSNKYFSDVLAAAKSPNDMTSLKLKFEELRLGAEYASLRRLVVHTVTSSVSNTANHISVVVGGDISRLPDTKLTNSTLKATLSNSRISISNSKLHELLATTTSSRAPTSYSRVTAIREVDKEDSKIVVNLDTSPPQWDTAGWLDKTWELEGFCPNVVVYNGSTLGDMMASDDQIQLGVVQLTVQGRLSPFAHGGVRSAAYARTAASTDRFVVKTYLKPKDHGLEHLTEDMHIQALCKAFALEFNGLVKSDTPLDFVVTSCLQTKAKGADSSSYVSLEPFLEGEYVKYNNNTVFAREDSDDDPFNRMAQAFSHFTFERSYGHLMVVDLQGVGTRLTDPSIHTKDPERFKLTPTNMREEGFKCFFAAHHCNPVCEQLGLKSDRSQASSGQYEFRERWPALDPTVCCSNKLCQRIVRLADALESEKFPGYRWCAACRPQLETSTKREDCVAPGPSHDFEVSRFFYESQGQIPPRKCAAHAEKDTSASGAAAAGSVLWNQMKSQAPQKESVSGSSW